MEEGTIISRLIIILVSTVDYLIHGVCRSTIPKFIHIFATVADIFIHAAASILAIFPFFKWAYTIPTNCAKKTLTVSRVATSATKEAVHNAVIVIPLTVVNFVVEYKVCERLKNGLLMLIWAVLGYFGVKFQQLAGSVRRKVYGIGDLIFVRVLDGVQKIAVTVMSMDNAVVKACILLMTCFFHSFSVGWHLKNLLVRVLCLLVYLRIPGVSLLHKRLMIGEDESELNDTDNQHVKAK